MRVMDAFSELLVNNFHVINLANMAHLPKKQGTDTISDFFPISRIHIIPKIIAKAMATWLAPKMNDLCLTLPKCFHQDSENPRQLYVRAQHC